MPELKEQIGEMLRAPTPKPADPGEQEPVETATEEVDVAGQAEEVASEESVEEPKVSEEEETKVDVATTVADLQKQVADLTAKLAAKELPVKEPEPEPEPEPAAPLFTKEQVEGALYDAEKMTELLNNVAVAVREQSLRAIPKIVDSTVTRQTALRNAADNFYNSNPELAAHKDYVTYVVQQVEGAHPDWTLAQVLEETATRAKASLGIRQQAVDRENERTSKPAFAQGPKGSSRAPAVDTRSELQRQIASVIGR